MKMKPAVNIIENDKEYKVEFAAPGLTKKDFRIEINGDDHLVVSMEKKNETKEEDKNNKYLRREFSYMNFRQSMILPDNVDKEQIQAKVEDGVLKISIPKVKAEEKNNAPKMIEIH